MFFKEGLSETTMGEYRDKFNRGVVFIKLPKLDNPGEYDQGRLTYIRNYNNLCVVLGRKVKNSVLSHNKILYTMCFFYNCISRNSRVRLDRDMRRLRNKIDRLPDSPVVRLRHMRQQVRSGRLSPTTVFAVSYVS